ncbi:MAG: Gfo/Idh/MocA family oxidoreductase [Bacillota bacterium]|nr:Gfo/Idh/MocA family oxidoreductase [Bacillota bacterium]
MEPVKLGILGCGIAAKDLHWPALKQIKDKFDIVTVCNHTIDKAKEFAQMVGNVPFVTDYKEVLANKEVEAVSILLPIHLNHQVTKEALEAGKHVIVEKPIAANLNEAEDMLTFESKYKSVMMVAENFRYEPLYIRAKELIDQGKIGKPYSAFWDCFSFLETTDKYAKTQWRIKHQYPGGFITDGGVHNIAVFRDLFGEIHSGKAITKSINPELGEIDSMSFLFNTSSNVSCVFNYYFRSNGYQERKLKILGTEGSMIIEDRDIIIKKKDSPDIKETVQSGGGYKEEFENFYDAIRNGKKVKCTFLEGYKDLKALIDAFEA